MMDFQNVNFLNVRLNMLSGNLLPMTSDNSLFPIAWRIYSAVIWLIEVVQTSAIIPGIMMVPIDKTLQDATVGLVVTVEVFFLLKQMNMHRNLISQLIRKLNNILRIEDKTMRNIVRSTLKPVEVPLKFYCMAGTGSIIVWCCIPFTLILKKRYFFYEDYRLPMVLSNEPFSREIFLIGSFFVSIASVYMFMKKVALDVYMINLVLLMTAQYRYTAIKLATIFRRDTLHNEHSGSQKMYYSNLDILAVREIKVLCRHHSAVIQ